MLPLPRLFFSFLILNYIFFFGCVKSWLQHVGSVSYGIFCCRGQAPECMGSVVMVHRLSCPVVCGILVPQPGIKPTTPALQGRFFNHWTIREVPRDSSDPRWHEGRLVLTTAPSPMRCAYQGSPARWSRVCA